MRRSIVFTAIIATLAFPAMAVEGDDLSTKSKSFAAAASVTVKQADAPFRAGRDPMPELMLREELARKGPRGGCEIAGSDLCYDLTDGRVVYRPARQYMPKVEGLRPEAISLRRDRVIFKYSFR